LGIDDKDPGIAPPGRILGKIAVCKKVHKLGRRLELARQKKPPTQAPTQAVAVGEDASKHKPKKAYGLCSFDAFVGASLNS
jgi:hypothetical protein